MRLILLAIITFFFSFQFPTDIITIYPSKGIDSIVLGEATSDDVLKFYAKRFNFTQSEMVRTDSPGKSRFKVLSNKDVGLKFTFAYKQDYLSEIKISSIQARFPNGIQIGTSTKKNVIEKFNVDSAIVNQFVEDYFELEKGSITIEFQFEDNNILKAVTLAKNDNN